MTEEALKRKMPRWHLVYYVLAAFDVLAVAGGLFLSHRFGMVHSRSLETIGFWEQQDDSYSRMAHTVSGFDDMTDELMMAGNVALVRSRLEGGVDAFRKRLQDSRTALTAAARRHETGPLLRQLDHVQAAMELTAQATALAIAAIERGDRKTAEVMEEAVDEREAILDAAVARMRTLAHEAQKARFAEHAGEAASLHRFEWLIAGAMLVMVSSATWYGHRLAGRARLQDQYLRENNGRLEEHVRARTQELVRSNEALEARAERQAALASLARHALAGADALMERAVIRAVETLHLDSAVVLELLPSGGELLVRAQMGHQEAVAGRTRVPADAGSHAGYTLKTGTPVIMEDVAGETRFEPSGLMRQESIQSGLAVVIGGQQRPFGVLGGHTRHRRTFTEDEVHFFESVAGMIAVAIEREQLERQFRQSQRLEALGQLAGGVSHDFNNLLSVIMGQAEILRRRLPNDERLLRSADEILKATDRAAGLTRQLLAFSRKQVLQPKPIDLNLVVADMEEMLHRLIGEDVELVTSYAPSLGDVMADPGQVEQVIMNLAVNARDAMPRGGRLAIETRNLDGGLECGHVHPQTARGPHVVLEVRDTGTGMDADTLARIFEPFFTTKEDGKGTGLGLATVHGIVQQSGGYLCVASEAGRGTSFRVHLPRIDQVRRSAGEVPRPAIEVAGGTETLLLVEDEAALRSTLSEALVGAGYCVLEATGPAHALALASSRRIDLVVSDVVMPRMSGPEVVKRLKVSQPEMKVVFISGYAGDHLSRQGDLDAGSRFLQKPVRPTALLEAVRAVLEPSERAAVA